MKISNGPFGLGRGSRTHRRKPGLPTLPPSSGTVLLLNFEDEIGSTTYANESGSGVVVQSFASRLSSGQKKFGIRSYGSVATNVGATITPPSPETLNFDGDFCIEGFIYIANITNRYFMPILYSTNGNLTLGVKGTLAGGSSSALDIAFSSGGTEIVVKPITSPMNRFIHVILHRVGGRIEIIADGFPGESKAFADPVNFGSGTVMLGSRATAMTGYNFVGYIDNFRIKKGSSPYQMNDSVVPPTSPLTA